MVTYYLWKKAYFGNSVKNKLPLLFMQMNFKGWKNENRISAGIVSHKLSYEWISKRYNDWLLYVVL